MDLHAKIEALHVDIKALHAENKALQAQIQGVSSKQIRPSNAEIEALQAQIQDVSFKEILHFRSALQAQLSLSRSSANASLVEILRKWLARIKSPKVAKKINASDITTSQIIDIFDLGNNGKQWALAKDNLVKVPLILKKNLCDLKDAFYSEDLEATCQIAIDIILVQC